MMNDQEPNDRQRKFIEAVARGLSAQEAARSAGYSKGYVRKASRLLKSPVIAKAVAEIRAEARTVAAYSLLEAVKEIDNAVLFAYTQKNAMAVAKLLEAKGRLFGLYVDRVQIETVDLKGALLEARSRVIDMHSLIPAQKLHLASAVLTATDQPTVAGPAMNLSADGGKAWAPFSGD